MEAREAVGGGVEAPAPGPLQPPSGQHAVAQVGQELVVERGVDEGVVAGRAHGEQVARHLQREQE